MQHAPHAVLVPECRIPSELLPEEAAAMIAERLELFVALGHVEVTWYAAF